MVGKISILLRIFLFSFCLIGCIIVFKNMFLLDNFFPFDIECAKDNDSFTPEELERLKRIIKSIENYKPPTPTPTPKPVPVIKKETTWEILMNVDYFNFVKTVGSHLLPPYLVVLAIVKPFYYREEIEYYSKLIYLQITTKYYCNMAAFNQLILYLGGIRGVYKDFKKYSEFCSCENSFYNKYTDYKKNTYNLIKNEKTSLGHEYKFQTDINLSRQFKDMVNTRPHVYEMINFYILINKIKTEYFNQYLTELDLEKNVIKYSYNFLFVVTAKKQYSRVHKEYTRAFKIYKNDDDLVQDMCFSMDHILNKEYETVSHIFYITFEIHNKDLYLKKLKKKKREKKIRIKYNFFVKFFFKTLNFFLRAFRKKKKFIKKKIKKFIKNKLK